MSKPKKIILTHPVKGDTEFDFQHAINIMTMEPTNGGWEWKNKADAKFVGTEEESAEIESDAISGPKQSTGGKAKKSSDSKGDS